MEYLNLLKTKNFKPHNFLLANGDTDSIMFKKLDGKAFSENEQSALLNELNKLMPDLIKWENDKAYKRCLVVKAKNYVLFDGKTRTTKGSALKASMKEPALKEFINEVIMLCLTDRQSHIFTAYNRYAQEIMNLTDISRWCKKVTVTKAVLEPDRTTERRILEAIQEIDYSEGDKVFIFFKTPEEYCVQEKFNGVYSKVKLLGKLFNTLEIFSTVIDIDLFPNYSLKRNAKLIGLEDAE